MASSVSSERAFSSAGITICKRRNRLDADIVEALQGLKSFISQDLMAREEFNIADEELELDNADEQPANQDAAAIDIVDASDDFTWGVISDEGDGIQVVKAGENTPDIEIE
jgi:hypothetical protein